MDNVTDSHRETMDTSIDDAFYVHASEGANRYERTADRMQEVKKTHQKHCFQELMVRCV